MERKGRRMTPGTSGTDGTDGAGADALVGREIAGYRLEELLGAGVNGKVYRARRVAQPTGAGESSGPEMVAIKVLLPDERMTAEQYDEFHHRLLREAETLQRLHHPNILSILSVGTQDNLTYLVLPYLANGTLAKLMSIGTLPFTEVKRIITQLASALDYAHAQGFVHRDIKPQNILMDDAGNPLLADFGLVRLLDSTRSKLSTTRFGAGTPVYMSPEQIQDRAVEEASDIYSLGVVAFQMLTGQLPFDSEEIFALMNKIVNVPPPLPRSLRPDLPEPAEAVIWQALDKQPEQRFTTAATFARALSAGLDNRWDPAARPITYAAQANSQPDSILFSRTTLPPVSWTPQPPPPQRRSLAPVALGAIALLLIVGLVFARDGLGAFFNRTPTATTGVGLSDSGGSSPSATSGKGRGPIATPRRTNGSGNPGNTGAPDPQPTTPPGQPTYTPYPTYTPLPTPTPLPTATPTPIILVGNLAPQASRSAGSGAVVDGNLGTEWIGGHGSASSITFSWPVAVTIHRIVVWDRSQSSSDNNQINLLGVNFSDGSGNSSIDMISGGPRCADINFSNKTVTWVTIYPNDASGNNGYKEIEIWAISGPQSSGNYCSNTRYI